MGEIEVLVCAACGYPDYGDRPTSLPAGSRRFLGEEGEKCPRCGSTNTVGCGPG